MIEHGVKGQTDGAGSDFLNGGALTLTLTGLAFSAWALVSGRAGTMSLCIPYNVIEPVMD